MIYYSEKIGVIHILHHANITNFQDTPPQPQALNRFEAKLTFQISLYSLNGLTIKFYFPFDFSNILPFYSSRSRFFDPLTEFRAEFQYDNLWYTWAGRTAERITGMEFEDVMTERILEVNAYISQHNVPMLSLAYNHTNGNEI